MPLFMECRHIKTNGEKCESPALRDGYFCYFHNRLKREARRQPIAQDEPLELPMLEDNLAIQLALSNVLRAIAAGKLDPRRAGMLLYGLQIASQNARIASSFAFEPVDTILESDEADELGPLQMRCDDEDCCDDECENKEYCDALEKELWQAEVEQFGQQPAESSEDPLEDEIPELPRAEIATPPVLPSHVFPQLPLILSPGQLSHINSVPDWLEVPE